LFASTPWLNTESLARTEVIEVVAQDGTALQGYFTAPIEGRAPYATIVMPHGGPAVRDYWRYSRDVQVLASQGYAVLQVNFRGSLGYGEAFQAASNQAWGTTVQDDIADATRWAISEGYTDKNRICIYGASFGAYSALMNAIREPGLYRCVAAFAGIYDLELMYKEGDIQTTSMGQAYLHAVIGEGELLRSQSPVHLINKLKTPLFIAHGGRDERAPIEQAEAIIAAAQAARVPVTTHINDSGGHGFNEEKSNSDYYNDLLEFLEDHLDR